MPDEKIEFEDDTEFDDDISWTPVELEAPSCDLENPDICESCT